jgi:putative peptidoglycan lipid II flippase
MAAIVIPAAVRSGLRFRPVWDWRHPAVRRLLTLSGWTFGFVVANQVAVVAIRNLALAEGAGLGSAYVDAFTWFVLPHGLLAVSVATTFQPELARAVTNRDRDAFVHHATLGTRVITGLTLPAAAAMFVLREPIIGFMQQRGAFDAVDRVNTADALGGFAVGLVGFSVYLFVLRGFYAHQDTRTPFVLNVGENLVNIVLAVVLVRWWGVIGLALAHAIAYLVAAVWALRVLARKVRRFPLGPIWSSAWRMLLAAVLMAEGIWFMTRHVTDDTGWRAGAQLVVGGGVGVIVYVAVLVALKAPELEWVRHRSGRS